MPALWVGTRKGLFEVRQGDGGWRIGTPRFPGEPVSQVLVDPHDGACYAALRLGHFGVKLWKSVDGGSEWKEIAAPAFPPKPVEGPWKDDPTPWTVDQVWSLEGSPDGRLWAGCLPAGLFTSSDGGASWQLVESLWDRPERKEWFGGGYDFPGIHSILVDPRDAAHVTLAISCGGVWQTRDGGASWANTSAGMVADFMPPERREDPNIQDPHRVSQCRAQPDVLWCQHHGGIFRSADGGARWHAVASPQPSGFGFPVADWPHLPVQIGWAAIPAAAILLFFGVLPWRVLVGALVVLIAAGGFNFDLLTSAVAFVLVFLVCDPAVSASTPLMRWRSPCATSPSPPCGGASPPPAGGRPPWR